MVGQQKSDAKIIYCFSSVENRSLVIPGPLGNLILQRDGHKAVTNGQ